MVIARRSSFQSCTILINDLLQELICGSNAILLTLFMHILTSHFALNSLAERKCYVTHVTTRTSPLIHAIR